MKVIFSRKGFDSASGKAPSPIIEGRPTHLPIPTERRSETSYRLTGLGEIVEYMTKGRIGADHLCHEDPAFENGRWAFGQTGAAQTHLEKNGVGIGDVFLFFGLFSALDGRDRHHRIFGYLKVNEVRRLGQYPTDRDNPEGFQRRHPHTIGEWNRNNTLYLGTGEKAKIAHLCLRLTKPGAPPCIWNIPSWLEMAGLSYHKNPLRWRDDGTLYAVARGQEFVSDIDNQIEAKNWLCTVQAAITQG